jgi:hypothetical protein
MRGQELAAVATPRTLVSSVIRAISALTPGGNRNSRMEVGASGEEDPKDDRQSEEFEPKPPEIRYAQHGEQDLIAEISKNEDEDAADNQPVRFMEKRYSQDEGLTFPPLEEIERRSSLMSAGPAFTGRECQISCTMYLTVLVH